MTAIVSEADEEVVALSVTEKRPTIATVWTLLVQAMLNPEDCDPFRPRQVQVRPEAKLGGLRAFLSAAGIGFALDDDLELIDDLFAQLNEDFHEDYDRCLLDMPGVTPALVRNAFQAAAAFYHRSPWKRAADAVVCLDCSSWSISWYAAITGAGNTKPGLVLSRELDTVKRIRRGQLSSRMARTTSALAVVFGSKRQMTETNLAMVKQYKLPVAGPRAYPVFIAQEPGSVVRPPFDHELQLLAGVLQAVPTFLNVRRPAKTAKVTLPSGEWELLNL